MSNQRPRRKKILMRATTLGINLLLITLATSSCSTSEGGGPMTDYTMQAAPQGGGAIATASAVAIASYDSTAAATAATPAPGGGVFETKEATARQDNTAIHMFKTDTLPVGTSFSYTFEAAKDNTATIELRRLSGTLDPYLRLLDANGQEIAADDDSGGGRDSLIRRRFETTGTYTIVVGSYNDASGGQFSLMIWLE